MCHPHLLFFSSRIYHKTALEYPFRVPIFFIVQCLQFIFYDLSGKAGMGSYRRHLPIDRQIRHCHSYRRLFLSSPRRQCTALFPVRGDKLNYWPHGFGRSWRFTNLQFSSPLHALYPVWTKFGGVSYLSADDPPNGNDDKIDFIWKYFQRSNIRQDESEDDKENKRQKNDAPKHDGAAENDDITRDIDRLTMYGVFSRSGNMFGPNGMEFGRYNNNENPIKDKKQQRKDRKTAKKLLKEMEKVEKWARNNGAEFDRFGFDELQKPVVKENSSSVREDNVEHTPPNNSAIYSARGNVVHLSEPEKVEEKATSEPSTTTKLIMEDLKPAVTNDEEIITSAVENENPGDEYMKQDEIVKTAADTGTDKAKAIEEVDSKSETIEFKSKNIKPEDGQFDTANHGPLYEHGFNAHRDLSSGLKGSYRDRQQDFDRLFQYIEEFPKNRFKNVLDDAPKSKTAESSNKFFNSDDMDEVNGMMPKDIREKYKKQASESIPVKQEKPVKEEAKLNENLVNRLGDALRDVKENNTNAENEAFRIKNAYEYSLENAFSKSPRTLDQKNFFSSKLKEIRDEQEKTKKKNIVKKYVILTPSQKIINTRSLPFEASSPPGDLFAALSTMARPENYVKSIRKLEKSGYRCIGGGGPGQLLVFEREYNQDTTIGRLLIRLTGGFIAVVGLGAGIAMLVESPFTVITMP